MERVEELVVRTADEARKEFIVDGGNTDYEVFLGQNCVKIIGRHHGGSDGKPEKYFKLSENYFNILLGIRPAVDLCGIKAGILDMLRTGTEASDD